MLQDYYACQWLVASRLFFLYQIFIETLSEPQNIRHQVIVKGLDATYHVPENSDPTVLKNISSADQNTVRDDASLAYHSLSMLKPPKTDFVARPLGSVPDAPNHWEIISERLVI